tara:strand:- start:66 stop:227 length:162 start_codon:yes stop_codon:yes gene_type:complete
LEEEELVVAVASSSLQAITREVVPMSNPTDAAEKHGIFSMVKNNSFFNANLNK